MKWLIMITLLATIACNKTEEAKPETKSQYTVAECQCMKIFDPVCADGQDFGNSCEAECQGHKQWTPGSCSDLKAPSQEDNK